MTLREGCFSAVKVKFLDSHMQNDIIKIHRLTTGSFMVLCHLYRNGGLAENRKRAVFFTVVI